MVAFAFGRKFGNAVERNRARRRLRAAFAQAWHDHPSPAGAYLIGGNRSVLERDFERLTATVGTLLLALSSGSPASATPSERGRSSRSPEVGR